MVMQQGFHELIQRRLADAEARLTALESDIALCRNLVAAYRTILEHEGQGLRLALPVNAPPRTIAERGPIPPRAERFADVSNREATVTLAREWGADAHHADQFAAAIWTLNTQAELRRVKRTLNSDLGRLARAGVLRKVGRNRYIIAA